jgi:hypothetical protein
MSTVLASDDQHVPGRGYLGFRIDPVKAPMKQFKPNLRSRRIILLHLEEVLPSVGERLLESDDVGVRNLADSTLGHFEPVHADEHVLRVACSARLELLENDDEVGFLGDDVANVRRRGPQGDGVGRHLVRVNGFEC